MTIGELARLAGVRISTLRFYEREGLLAAASRSAKGYRRYVATDVDRVRFLRRAQTLGFTLGDCAALLTVSQQTSLSRADIERAGTQKLDEIDARIADLLRVRTALASLLAAPCIDVGAPCPVVAALAHVDA